MSRCLPFAVALTGLSLAGLSLSVLSLSACDREQRAPAQPESAAAADTPAQPGDAFAGKIDRSHKGAALPQATVTDASGLSR